MEGNVSNFIDNSKNNQADCMGCGKPWRWSDKDILDFNLPVGKRIWPAVCLECRTELQRRYQSKEITRTQLMLEFSTISARISKRCAVPDSIAIEKLKTFVSKKRGK